MTLLTDDHALATEPFGPFSAAERLPRLEPVPTAEALAAAGLTPTSTVDLKRAPLAGDELAAASVEALAELAGPADRGDYDDHDSPADRYNPADYDDLADTAILTRPNAASRTATLPTARPTTRPATRPTARASSLAAADWTALGTRIRLLVTDPARLPAARSLLESDLDDLDRACSRFRPDSEIAVLDAADGALVALSPLLTEAVSVALAAARRTGGDLDPTVGGAIVAAGYDRDFAEIPADGPGVAYLVERITGWRQVEFDPGRRELRMPAGTRLDLGATAKAWAADRAAGRLAERLRCGVLVSLGGDIAVAGPAPDGGWRVRVQDVTGHPDEPPAGPAQTVLISSGGLATSSIAARRWRRGGRTLHHIFDPRTGMPAQTDWRTVSVAARSCVAANTASTCAIIRGRRALGDLAREHVSARLVDRDGAVTTTGGWPSAGEA